MRYTVTREDGRVLTFEWDGEEPYGYTVTGPAGSGIVTQFFCHTDFLQTGFDQAEEAAADLSMPRDLGGES